MKLVAMVVALTSVALTGVAHADEAQADLGLAVVGAGYEHDVTPSVSVMLEAQIFGTYFLPWFDAGENLTGFGGQTRITWFSRTGQRGLYVEPFVRVDRATDKADTAFVGFCAGAHVGWAFALPHRIDLRVGGGAQYMKYGDAVSTPFIGLDLVVGYRL